MKRIAARLGWTFVALVGCRVIANAVDESRDPDIPAPAIPSSLLADARENGYRALTVVGRGATSAGGALWPGRYASLTLAREPRT